VESAELSEAKVAENYEVFRDHVGLLLHDPPGRKCGFENE